MRPSVPLLAALAAQACHSAGAPAGTLHSDSAGVAVATAVEPAWGPGEGWTVGEQPLLQIGTAIGDPDYQLDGVVGAVRLSSGDIVLGDGGSGELRRYDAGGTFVWRAAGEGEGPGEHQFLSYLGALAGDSLVSYDLALQRVQIFDAEGELVRTLPIESPWRGSMPRRALGVSGRHLVVSFADRTEMPEGGVVRWPHIRVATVDLADGAVEAVSNFPGAEQVVEDYGESVAFMAYDFGKGPRFAVTPGRLAAVDTDAFNIRSISLGDGGTERILRRDIAPTPVTSAHVDAEIEAYIETNVTYGGVSREQAEEMGRRRREDPRAPTLPVLRSIRLDEAGNLWVEPFFGAGIDVGPFEVFAADGAWLGAVSVPSGLRRGFTADMAPGLEIGDDYLLGVWSDAQGIEYVRLYSIDKS
ncbi:MAG: hypothetical protein F4Z33_00800 [Gemmatimonadales bacterium]|nr:hypothetical protein [Gemmatimonadales bacterium]MYC87745.1 hypothetical protein [Candidatus Palauibacter denitrificans]